MKTTLGTHNLKVGSMIEFDLEEYTLIERIMKRIFEKLYPEPGWRVTKVECSTMTIEAI